MQKTLKTPKKAKCYQWTDGPMDRQTNRHSGLFGNKAKQANKVRHVDCQTNALQTDQPTDQRTTNGQSQLQRCFVAPKKWSSLFLLSGWRKLVCFGGQMSLHTKLTAKKKLIFLFQLAPSRILSNKQFFSYDFFYLFFHIFPEDQYFSLILMWGPV